MTLAVDEFVAIKSEEYAVGRIPAKGIDDFFPSRLHRVKCPIAVTTNYGEHALGLVELEKLQNRVGGIGVLNYDNFPNQFLPRKWRGDRAITYYVYINH